MFEKEKFAQRLSLLLQQHNISKQTLGTAIGVSRPAISQFASGANLPSIDKLVALAEYFNVSVDYLIGLSDIPDKK
ncbi:MAG: helix-turn-helix domain protein [Sporomusa sp.]|jgi:transcriptional regulator with XRE-family HTH domain|nr:helix-turn-helix domain protein [Sporomusa sp.]